ncbi:hypothetical protein D3C87_1628960 [compost metagenome]
MIDVALDDELVRVGENVGERGRHLLAIGLLQPDVEFLVLDLRFQHGGCLCHDLSPIRFGKSYWCRGAVARLPSAHAPLSIERPVAPVVPLRALEDVMKAAAAMKGNMSFLNAPKSYRAYSS